MAGVVAVFTEGSDAYKRVQMQAGMAAKNDAALWVAKQALGEDRAMSNFRQGRVKLGAGFDVERTDVVLHLRPAGAWVLADAGRKKSGQIMRVREVQRTTRAGNVRTRKVRVVEGGRSGGAVLTPQGPRASSTYGPSRGLRVIARTAKRAEQVVFDAAQDAIAFEAAQALEG
jgi:hypothetical protein